MKIRLIASISLLLVSPAIADVTTPNKMCTQGYKLPAYLLFVGTGFELHVGKNVEYFDDAGSLGAGFVGRLVLSKGNAEPETMIETEITMFSNGAVGGDSSDDIQPLIIFRDRAFWSCKK